MAGDAAGLVDDDKAGVGHNTIAVSVSPSRTDQRPDSVSSGGPNSAAGSMRMRESKLPAVPLSSTSNVLSASSKPSQRWGTGNHAFYASSLAPDIIPPHCSASC